MRIGSSEIWILISLLVVAWSSRGALGIRFVIDREECFSHKVEMGETVHFSFVVIKSEGSWHYSEEGVDLVVYITQFSLFLCFFSLSSLVCILM